MAGLSQGLWPPKYGLKTRIMEPGIFSTTLKGNVITGIRSSRV